ncbi:hypothetical protein BS78_03G178600 [Paspalum vaginatum]|nr:hypothetical protein BS78_03G178600 [Paspalum vaginatum]
MAARTRKATGATKALPLPISCVPGAGGAIRDDDKTTMRTPKGYVPMVLVRDDDEGGAETRVLVRVRDLGEPCMAALLELAEQQFGYAQQGVLRVPCDAQRFEHVVNMARK